MNSHRGRFLDAFRFMASDSMSWPAFFLIPGGDFHESGYIWDITATEMLQTWAGKWSQEHNCHSHIYNVIYI